MAEIQIQFDMDDESMVPKILDAISDISGAQMFGLLIDGEHRDPDEPNTSLFS